jgi:hypothetical protein
MNGEQTLPLGRFNVAPVKPLPYDQLGVTQSYDGIANTERNRVISYRHPTPTYNSAEFGKRASQEDGTIVGGSGGGGAISLNHPWQITSRVDGGGIQFKIEEESKIFRGTGTFNTFPVSGLNEWVTANIGYIILESTIVDYEITDSEIIWGAGSDLTRAEYDSTEDFQTITRIRIGEIYLNEFGLQVRQMVFSNLTPITTCYDGNTTICLFPT